MDTTDWSVQLVNASNVQRLRLLVRGGRGPDEVADFVRGRMHMGSHAWSYNAHPLSTSMRFTSSTSCPPHSRRSSSGQGLVLEDFSVRTNLFEL